ncbi:MAG: hypothetical protein Q8P41_30875 [Pseudomonadota bacterium]|nr:hypothetical protein [Pseudomonadota bacterium]
MQVYRWDLDKTYLQTDIDSVRGLVRSAIEPASAKRAVPGAPALLRELARERPGWRPRIFILSGSPTQMRPVLEQKLRMDGVRFDEFVLKDNLGNLRKGRLRAVRGQFGYKLPQLLRARVGLGSAVRESLFGDDAEVDALVYSVYADAIAGRIGPTELSRLLAASGAYPDHIVEALAALRRVAQADAVDRIFIRLDRGRPLTLFEPLGPRVVPVRSWFEAALTLYGSGELSAVGVERVRASIGLTDSELVGYFASVLGRGFVEASALSQLLNEVTPDPMWAACEGELARGPFAYRPPIPPGGIDYLDVLRGFAR